MKKHKKLKILFIIFIALVNVLVFWRVHVKSLRNSTAKIYMTVSAEKEDVFQVYYTTSGGDLSEDKSAGVAYDTPGQKKEMEFAFPYQNSVTRIDLGSANTRVDVYDLYMVVDGQSTKLDVKNLDGLNASGISAIEKKDGASSFAISDNDPYFYAEFNRSEIETNFKKINGSVNLIWDIIICILLDLVAFYSLKHLDAFVKVPIEIFQNRKLAFSLSKSDFKTKYAGSYFGIVWAFIQPVTTILVYWFVFQVGLKSGGVTGVPFVIFLVTGIVPWFFFSDALTGGMNSMMEYSYLVKKVVFNIDILPFVKVVSAIFVHLFFILFALLLNSAYGYFPSIYTIQLIYYVICNFVFVLGLVYLCSAVVVFFKDLGQFINIVVLQVGMWMTPIMWNAKAMLPPWLLLVFKVNPMYYIVDGFRDSMIYKQWFFGQEKLLWTIYFWAFTILLFGFGNMIFRKLKVHFADVL